MRAPLLLMPLLLMLMHSGGIFAETGTEGWLRYQRIPAASETRQDRELPQRVVVLDSSPIAQNAASELARGLLGELELRTHLAPVPEKEDAFVLGTPAELRKLIPDLAMALPPEGFAIVRKPMTGRTLWILAGSDSSAELFAVFHLLQGIATLSPNLEARDAPAAPIRWVNQWDNLDGSIERGYAGRSIFFDGGHVRGDLSRASQYARLLASIAINGCTVNNVNSDLRTLTPEMLVEFARIADAFRPWGVRLSLSVDLSSPQVVGHLPTFDPLDPTVIAWWQQKVDEIYTVIPDFAGVVVKADSEGRAGPSQYGRTPSQAANMLARALKPHHGIVMYRGFVYNHHLDWHNSKADRARAGFDNFASLDGTFEPNVVIQIKHGPIDFQVREPVSPLFAALQHTAQALELQTSQEYTGQQRHMVFLVPMWKTALDTDLRAQNRSTPLKEIVEGRSFHQPLGGFVSVVNVGLDENWLHHPMAMANLYGYGRLAWNPDLGAEQIVDEWTRMTFGNDPAVVRTVDDLQLSSWKAYEDYTGPLGLGTLTDIIGVHFGPGIESAERNGWGQWIRADHEGVGMDRTVATGTGYIGQYPPELARVYESLASCPDALLLFMHHVPYTYRLHSDTTVIQHIYDSHYQGAAMAASYAPRWESLRGKIDEERFAATLKLFRYQAGHAIVWRDAVNEWFLRMSGVADTRGRVGHDPDRIEAEAMTATGYTATDVHPWETASGGKAVTCKGPDACVLTLKLDRPAGDYDIAVQYFDLRQGVSRFEVLLNGKPIGRWLANDTLPPAANDNHLDGHTSTRFTASHIALAPGDVLSLRGAPDGVEEAPVDYLEITPALGKASRLRGGAR